MEKVSVGIVGAKFAAGFHIKGWQSVPGVEIGLKGITDLNKDAAEQLVRKHPRTSMKVYDSLDNMLEDSEIDIIDVCVPDYAHEQVAIAAAQAGKHAVVEKLLTGYFGTKEQRKSDEPFGLTLDREVALEEALKSCDRIQQAFDKNEKSLMYAENWVYAPNVEKVAELLSKNPKTKILFIEGEESHRGSHSPAYGIWGLHGSGATSGKLCHPIGAVLRLKYEEGMRLRGEAFRPVAVSAITTHNWKDIEDYEKFVKGAIRTDYRDVEDGVYATIMFDDNTIANVRSNEYSVGGVLNTLRVDASNQRHRINLAPNTTLSSYAVDREVFGLGDNEAYLTEKVDNRAGHQFPAANEEYDLGYEAEFENFAHHIASIKANSPSIPLLSDMMLARDTVLICYGALLSAERKGTEVNLA